MQGNYLPDQYVRPNISQPLHSSESRNNVNMNYQWSSSESRKNLMNSGHRSNITAHNTNGRTARFENGRHRMGRNTPNIILTQNFSSPLDNSFRPTGREEIFQYQIEKDFCDQNRWSSNGVHDNFSFY